MSAASFIAADDVKTTAYRPLTSLASQWGQTAPPYTRVLLMSNSMFASGLSADTGLPTTLQTHISLDEWSEFKVRVQPVVEKVGAANKQLNRIGVPLVFFVLAGTGGFFFIPLEYFGAYYFGFALAYWGLLFAIMTVYTRSIKTAYASQLAELRAAFVSEEERLFRPCGLAIECDYVLASSGNQGQISPFGFYLYFFPQSQRQLPDQELTESDSFDGGIRNGYLRIQIDGVSSSKWWCRSGTVCVSPPLHLESFRTLPFAVSPAAAEVWHRFWTRFTEQTRELGSTHDWYMPLLYTAILFLVFFLTVIKYMIFIDFNDSISEYSTYPLLLVNLLCMICVMYGSSRVSALTADRRALVEEYTNEFAAQGLFVEDRYDYQVHRCNPNNATLAYYIHVFQIDHSNPRKPDMV